MKDNKYSARGSTRTELSQQKSASVLEMFKAVQSLFVKVNEFGIAIGRMVERARDGVGRFQDRAAQFVDTFARGLSQIGQALAQLDELLRTLELIHERFGVIMLSIGLPPVAELGPAEKQEIITYHDSHTQDETRQYVQDWLLTYFDAARLATLVSTWELRPWLAKRIPILKEAVEAHNEAKYFVSVPVIFSQIEGMVADNFAVKKYMNQTQYKTYLQSLLDPKSLREYPEQIGDFLLNTVLVQFTHGAPIGSNLSRHAILHGADSSYGTAINSLTTILLFNYIQDSFRLVATSTGKCFHFIGCPILAGRGAKRVFFSTLLEAQRAGLRACKRCVEPSPAEFWSLVEDILDPSVLGQVRKYYSA